MGGCASSCPDMSVIHSIGHFQTLCGSAGQLKLMSCVLDIHKLARFVNSMGAVNQQHVCICNAFKCGRGEEGQGVSQWK